MINLGLSCGYCFKTVATVLVYKPEDILKIKDCICRECDRKGVQMTNFIEGLDKLK